jgi:hypothetical protein
VLLHQFERHQGRTGDGQLAQNVETYLTVGLG